MKVRKAKGTLTPEGNRKIAITFKPALFKRLAEEAAKLELPFGKLVKVYLEMGMKEWELRK